MPSLVAEAASVLGLSLGPGGTPPEEDAIAAAFKKLAIRWHPDRSFAPGSHTTHGLSTEELRERLAAAGVGVRMATAADFG